MKNKKVWSLMLVGLMSLTALTGCAGKSNTPEGQVDDFILSVKTLDFEKANSILAMDLNDVDEDDDVLTSAKDEFDELDAKTKKEIEALPSFKDAKENLEAMYTSVEYEVLSEDIQEDHAEVTVRMNHASAVPVIEGTFQDVIGDLFSQMFGTLSVEDDTPSVISETEQEVELLDSIFKAFNKHVSSVDKDVHQGEGKFTLVKKDDKWVITAIDDELINALTLGVFDMLGDLGESLGGSFDFQFDMDDSDLENMETPDGVEVEIIQPGDDD